MDSFSTFLYQSGISIAVFYLFYRALLRRETWFSLNRILLGASLLLAILIPFVRITLHSAPAPGTVYYALDHYLMNGVLVHPDHLVESTGLHITAGKALLSVYLMGVLFFMVKFLTQIMQVLHLIKKHGIREFEGYRIVPITEEISPFSFFTLIFINTEKLGKQELRSILLHEWEHVRRLHTLDILLLEIICIIQWFNPFVWLYKYSLHELHEYEADQAVISQGENRLNYQKLILNQAFGHQFFQVAHNLINRSFIKNRILMITKRKSGSITLLKSLLILPVAALLVVSFSFTREPEQMNNLRQALYKKQKTDTTAVTFAPPITGQQGITITSGYGMRIHPETKTRKFHFGVDFKAQKGTPVLATAAGTVTWAKRNGKFGNEVRILHSGNLESRYDHLDQIKVKENEAVKQGQIIGTIGNSGVPSSKPHLHFAMLKNGKFVYPSTYIHFREISGNQSEIQSIQKSKSDDSGSINNGQVSPDQDTTRGKVFFIVEEMPKFQGGDIQKFRQWVAEHLRYPEKAAEKGISGRVYVQFVVEPDGSVDRVKVVRSANYQSNRKVISSNDSLLNREAVRVIKASPEWAPGKQRGKNVAVAFTIPIIFVMDDIKKPASQISDSSDVFFIVEEMPEFQGGDVKNFSKWVAENIKYPDEALKKGISGNVFIQFIVEPDGHVDHVKVIRGIDPSLDAEALRVVRSSPKWEPGKQRNHKVPVVQTIPITFVRDYQWPSRDSMKAKQGKKVVYIIDGKKATEGEIKTLDHNRIARVRVSKDIKDIEKYGPGSEEGVIFISTYREKIKGPVPPPPKPPVKK